MRYIFGDFQIYNFSYRVLLCCGSLKVVEREEEAEEGVLFVYYSAPPRLPIQLPGYVRRDRQLKINRANSHFGGEKMWRFLKRSRRLVTRTAKSQELNFGAKHNRLSHRGGKVMICRSPKLPPSKLLRVFLYLS